MSLGKLAIATKRLSDPKVLERLIIDAAKPFEAEIIDLNTGQLEKGLLSTGEKIKPPYSPEYANFKGFKTPDLKLEGDYYSGKYVKFGDTFMVMDSNDEKSPFLQTKYTEDIDGLTEDSIDELVNEHIADEFINLFENELFK